MCAHMFSYVIFTFVCIDEMDAGLCVTVSFVMRIHVYICTYTALIYARTYTYTYIYIYMRACILQGIAQTDIQRLDKSARASL
jgi:hypothetical protein